MKRKKGRKAERKKMKKKGRKKERKRRGKNRDLGIVKSVPVYPPPPHPPPPSGRCTRCKDRKRERNRRGGRREREGDDEVTGKIISIRSAGRGVDPRERVRERERERGNVRSSAARHRENREEEGSRGRVGEGNPVGTEKFYAEIIRKRSGRP